jgi:hypothetical protein
MSLLHSIYYQCPYGPTLNNIPPCVPEDPTCRKMTPVTTFPSDRIVRATLINLLLDSNTTSLSFGKFAGNIMASNQKSS